MFLGETLEGGSGGDAPRSRANSQRILRCLGSKECTSDTSLRARMGYRPVESLFKQALAGKYNARKSLTRVEWDVSLWCEDPILVTHAARKEPVGREYRSGAHTPLQVDVYGPCRKCSSCLKSRGLDWMSKAAMECDRARTWMLTLTLRPDMHRWVTNHCRIVEARNGHDFDALGSSQQYLRRHAVISKEITRFLKRVRKTHPIRYLLVAEAHTKQLDGLPHYHLLVHQQGKYLSARRLRRSWTWGNTHAALVEDGPEAAWYVAKYLVKSSMARVRASQLYGSNQGFE